MSAAGLDSRQRVEGEDSCLSRPDHYYRPKPFIPDELWIPAVLKTAVILSPTLTVPAQCVNDIDPAPQHRGPSYSTAATVSGFCLIAAAFWTCRLPRNSPSRTFRSCRIVLRLI